MAQNQLLRRYLDAGMQFTQMTQQRAEAIVRDLVKAGELQAEQAQSTVSELVDRSRKNTDRLLDQVRSEVRKQLQTADVVTREAFNQLQGQIDVLRRQVTGRGGSVPTPEPVKAAKKALAKKAPAKKAAAKKAAASKAAVKGAGAKKAAAKKTSR